MSVLLDALKKAAEEKKNAENGVQAPAVEEINASESSGVDEVSTDNIGLKLTLEEPVSTAEVDSNETELASDDSVTEEPDLPIFNLQESGEALADNSALLPDESPELKLEQPNTDEVKRSLEINDESVPDNSQDLTSLIDSLDLGEESPAENIRLDSKQEHSLETALSVEQQHQPDFEPLSIEPSDTVSSQSSSIPSSSTPAEKDDFQWSMDELPGYAGNVSGKKMDSTAPLEQNPILIKGDNSPQKASGRYTTSSKVIVSLFVVLLFIGIGFYGMLYYQEQNEALERSMRQYNISKIQLVSPKPATQQASPIVEESSEVLSLNVVKQTVEENNNEVVDSAALVEQDEANTVEELPVSSSQQTKETEVKPEQDSSLLTAKDAISTVKAKKAPPVASKNTATKNAKPTSSAEKRYRTVKTKKILPKKAIVQVKKRPALVREAYSAYNDGKFGLAKQKFTTILANDRENITALLGLGGVAVAEGKHYEAISYYQRILDTNPNNLNAFESIANLSGQVPLNKEWEQELFRMAQDYPRSSTLQYAKGNIYAKNKDWLSAQESYFNALVLDSSNPDYMMNLAVSYDHLGKYKLASQYYTQALAFANRKRVSFDQNQVRNRLISIRQFIVKGS